MVGGGAVLCSVHAAVVLPAVRVDAQEAGDFDDSGGRLVQGQGDEGVSASGSLVGWAEIEGGVGEPD